MATGTELTATETITSTSKDSCEILAIINESPTIFTFGKNLLFTFGVRCDGDMTNILDMGMEVNISYRLFDPQIKPTLVAVWLGDKPDFTESYCQTFSAVYNQTGCVILSFDDDFLVQNVNYGYGVLVNKKWLLKDSFRVDFEVTLGVNDIIFDAAPLKMVHSTGALYRATCAWVGDKIPRIVDRFGLNDSNDICDLTCPREIDGLHGTVVVIPNDVLAFVDVETETSVVKVMMFWGSFGQLTSRKALKYALQVGDKLYMRIRLGFIFPGCCQWFAVKVLKETVEVGVDYAKLNTEKFLFREFVEPQETDDNLSDIDDITKALPVLSLNETEVQRFVSPKLGIVMSDKRSLSHASVVAFKNWSDLSSNSSASNLTESVETNVPKSAPVPGSDLYPKIENYNVNARAVPSLSGSTWSLISGKTRSGSNSEVPSSVASVYGSENGADSNESIPHYRKNRTIPISFKLPKKQASWKLGPFKKSIPSVTRSLLLNFAGILKIDEDGCVKIIHLFGESFIGRRSHILSGINDNKPMDTGESGRFNGRAVRFDAEALHPTSGKIIFSVKRLWLADSVRPSPAVTLLPKIQYSGSASFPQKVLLQGSISSLPLHDAAIASVSGIDVLVPLDSLFTNEKVDSYSCSIDAFMRKEEKVVLEVQKVNDFEGQLYFIASSCWKIHRPLPPGRKTQLIRVDDMTWFNIWGKGQYFKNGFIEKRDAGYFLKFVSYSTISLYLFKKGNIYVNGILTDTDNVRDLDGREVTFHAAHTNAEAIAEISSDGLFVSDVWIGEQPSPMVVLRGKLAVPKGLIYPNRFYEGIIVEFPLPTHAICKIGVVPVLVPLQEKRVNDRFVGIEEPNLKTGEKLWMLVQEVVFQNETFLVCNGSLKILYRDNDILKYVPGIVTCLPRPVGTIKSGSVEVSFVLCNIQSKKETCMNRTELLSWMESLNEKIKIGSSVYFSAVKVNSKSAHAVPFRAFEVFLN